ncbi:MAG: response regulator [Labilithrix sp.]
MSTASRVEAPRVLIVEDEPALLASMVRGLGKLEGVDIRGAGSVREARQAIQKAAPDMVVTDLDLPDGSGIDVVGELDRIGVRIPIAFVSAYVHKYRARLPTRPGCDILEKPVSLERLRHLVEDRLRGDEVLSSPFSATDYIQLAGMGRRSLTIEVRGRVAGRGRILIRSGEIWSAEDDRGTGEDAFRRLVFLKDAMTTCEPLDPRAEVSRTIHGSCISVMLEAARRMDEEELLLEDGDWEELPVPNTTATAKRGFEDLYEEGVDALLKKRFDIAFRAFSEAEQLKPGDPSVHANLERLRQMGWAS